MDPQVKSAGISPGGCPPFEKFHASRAASLARGGQVICDRPAMLVWPRQVFHRITSGEQGSISLNFAARAPDCDMKTNFNIYDIDTENGVFTLIREGYLDQS